MDEGLGTEGGRAHAWPRRLRFVMRRLWVVPVVAVNAVVALAALGLVLPVANSHCLAEGEGSVPRIESGWGVNWLGGGFPNPAPDGGGCVRNTPTREALSMLGVWPLGSPEHQVARNVLE